MSKTHRFGLIAAGLVVAQWSASAAAADMAFMDDPDFDPAEYKCLVAAIYDGAAELESDELQRTAWVLSNRSASAEFPGTYCEMAADVEKQGPWADSSGGELVRSVMSLETGSDAYKSAVAALETYRTEVHAYRQAQTAAYMLIRGWYEEDPTGGATSLASEIDEADAESG